MSQSHNALAHQPHPEIQRRLNVEIGVYEGPPKYLVESGVYTVENIPHIHDSDLTIRHPLSEEDVHVGDTRVMVAHGYRKKAPEGDDSWVLADGRPVIEVAEHYNESYPDKPIELLAVCNPAENPKKEHDTIQHTSGSTVEVSGYINDSGAIGMHLRLTNPDTGSWFLRDGSGTLRPAL